MNPVFWSLSFRPFFIFSVFWSFLVMSTWTLINKGYSFLDFYVPTMYWHGHEMIFGFTSAVLAGFLFTASHNWTGKVTLTKKQLIIFSVFWGLGRFFSLTQYLYIYLICDLLFFISFTYFLYKVLFIKEQRRNHIFILLTALLTITNLMVHLGFIVNKKLLIMIGLHVGLNLVLIYISVITGRIIPFFTKKALAKSNLVSNPMLDRLATGSLVAVLLVSSLGPTSKILLTVTMFAAILHLIRWVLWKPHEAFKSPILFTLYFSYFWMILGLFFMSSKGLLGLPTGVALHSLTVGALGGFLFSMMCRVSLGHTGRIMKSTPVINLIFLLIHFAAFVRVFVPIISMEYYSETLLVSGLFWCIACLLFLFVIGPYLLKDRVKA